MVSHGPRESGAQAYSEANHRHSVESLPRRLEADLQEVKLGQNDAAGYKKTVIYIYTIYRYIGDIYWDYNKQISLFKCAVFFNHI